MSTEAQVPSVVPDSLPPSDYMVERETMLLKDSDDRNRHRLNFFNIVVMCLVGMFVLAVAFAVISLIVYYFGPEGFAWIGAAQIEKIEKLTSQPAFGAIVGSLGTVLLREFRRLLPDFSPKEPPDGP